MRDDNRTPLPLVEEELVVDKKMVSDGRVVVSTRTKLVEEAQDVELGGAVADVERVPLGIVVDAAPEIRVEGDVTIVPVVEERLIVEKRLVLVEEIRIRRTATFRTEHVEARLRKQHATVERISEDEEAKEIDHG